MLKSSTGLVVSLALTLGAFGCSDGGGGGTGTAGTTGGRGGTSGGTAGTGGGAGGATAGSSGGSTAGTGGGSAGSGGGTGGATAGSGGATGGATAGTGGATGGATAGAGGRGGGGGTGGGTAGSGGATAGSGGATGGSTAGTGGGTAGTGGGTAGTGGGPVIPPNPALTGTATRPQLAAGTDYTILKYFEKTGALGALTTDNWNPTVTGAGDVATFTATYTVAASGGTHTSIQAALDAAVAAGGTARVYIKVEPGTYRETVCHRANTPPITLYSANADASMTVIVNNGNAGKVYTDPPATDPRWNPCAATNPPAAGSNYGTSGSATVAIYARDFHAKNLTFANDFAEGAATSNIQAVALMTQQDKLIFENVRVLGHQDSLYVKTGNVDTVQRAYFKGCYVEGDTDFIFGRATFVLDGCEIKYLGARRGATSGGYVVSPSTDVRNAYGLLIINSMFTSDGVPNAGTVALGRAWDEGQQAASYPTATAAGGYPNGQVVIRDSVLGAHIIGAAPWAAAATTSRAYSSVAAGAIPANRLWELSNTGAGAAP
jgi:pectinesterase